MGHDLGRASFDLGTSLQSPPVPNVSRYNTSMGHSCCICTHDKATEITAALRAEGARAVAERFGVSKSAADRHKHRCIGVPSSSPASLGAFLDAPDVEEIEVSPSTQRAPSRGPGRPCSICQRSDRASIDQRLILEGPSRALSRDIYGNEDHRVQLRNHANKCIPNEIQEAQAKSGAVRVRAITDTLAVLRDDADDLLDSIQREKDRIKKLEEKFDAFEEAHKNDPKKAQEIDVRCSALTVAACRSRKSISETHLSITRVLQLAGQRSGELTQKMELSITKHSKWTEFKRSFVALIVEIEDEELATKFTELLTTMEAE